MKRSATIMVIWFSLALTCYSKTSTVAFANFNSGDAKIIAMQIVNQMNDGKYEEARTTFSDQLKQNLGAKQMKDAWVGFQLQLGKIKDFGEPLTFDVQGYKKVTIEINYENGKANCEVSFDENNQVVGLWLKPKQ